MKSLIAILVCLSVVPLTFAADEGSITISPPWSRATAPGAPTAAGFLVISNETNAADTLVSASATISEIVELHTHSKDEQGVMRMNRVDSFVIDSGASLSMKPGAEHVMFIGLKAPLTEGQTFELTLSFEKAGDRIVPVTVMAAGAKSGCGCTTCGPDSNCGSANCACGSSEKSPKKKNNKKAAKGTGGCCGTTP